MDIAALHSAGCRIEQILEHFDSTQLTHAEVFSALAYFYDVLAAQSLGGRGEKKRSRPPLPRGQVVELPAPARVRPMRPSPPSRWSRRTR
jgi:hypothetical protein